MAFGSLSVKGRALRHLAQRDHSRAELARKLARKVKDIQGTDSTDSTHGKHGTDSTDGRPGTASTASTDGGSSMGNPDCTASTDCGARTAGKNRKNRTDSTDSTDRPDGGNAISASQQIEAALDELTANGLLSDERAADSLMHSQSRRFGERRLKQTMQLRGFAPELVASTLAQARGSEFERAREVWRRKFGTPAQDAAQRGKQMRFLMGRGFSAEVASRVLRESSAALNAEYGNALDADCNTACDNACDDVD